MKLIKQHRLSCDEDYSILPKLPSIAVDFERKPILYLPDDKVLVRVAGFTSNKKV